MEDLPRAFAVSQTPSSLTSDRGQPECEPIEGKNFIPKELPALPHLKGQIADPSTTRKNPIVRKPIREADNDRLLARIVLPLVAGLFIAGFHHIFILATCLEANSYFLHYWVKVANNAFSVVFSICIASVASRALTQMKWNAAGSNSFSIRTIDNLFSLPSPVALFRIATRRRSRPLLPIFTAIFIQSLALVTIFAPNSMVLGRGGKTYGNITIPNLDLSTGPLTSIPATNPIYTSASQLWSTILTSIMIQPPLASWKIPADCGSTCTFELVYDGPGLQCMDTPSEPLSYTGDDEFTLVYNATSTLYPPPPADSSSSWEIEDQYELKISYIATNNSNLNIGDGVGSVHCVFRNATYKASFHVQNNTMEVNHSIQSYGGTLGTVQYGESDRQCSGNSSQPCFINGVNTRAMCDVFASALTGQIRHPRANVTEAIGLPDATGGINEAVIDLLFSHAYYSVDSDFHLAVSNLSESLVSLFSNLTLGFIPRRNDATTVQAVLWDDGSYVCSYTQWILWSCYLPALLLASLSATSLWSSLQSNKRVIDDKFSDFLLATRNTELEDLCMNAKDFAGLLKFRLLYQMEKGSFSAASSGEYTK